MFRKLNGFKSTLFLKILLLCKYLERQDTHSAQKQNVSHHPMFHVYGNSLVAESL